MVDKEDKQYGEYITVKEMRVRKQNIYFIIFLSIVIFFHVLVSIFSLTEAYEIMQGIPHDPPSCPITPIGDMFIQLMISLSAPASLFCSIILLFRKKYLPFFLFIGIEILMLLATIISFMVIAPDYPYETIIYCLDLPFSRTRLLIWFVSGLVGSLAISIILHFLILYIKRNKSKSKNELVDN